MKKRMGRKLISVLFAAVLSASAVRAQAPDTVTFEQLDKPFGTNAYAVFNKLLRDVKKSDAPKDCIFSVEVVVDTNGIPRKIVYTGSCVLLNIEDHIRKMYFACYMPPKMNSNSKYARMNLTGIFNDSGALNFPIPDFNDIGLFNSPNPINNKLIMQYVGFPPEAKKRPFNHSPDEIKTITYLLVDTSGKSINTFYEFDEKSKIYAEYIAPILKEKLNFEPATLNGNKVNSWTGILYTFKYLGTYFRR